MSHKTMFISPFVPFLGLRILTNPCLLHLICTFSSKQQNLFAKHCLIWPGLAGKQVLLNLTFCTHVPFFFIVLVCNRARFCAAIKGQLPPQLFAIWSQTKEATGPDYKNKRQEILEGERWEKNITTYSNRKEKNICNNWDWSWAAEPEVCLAHLNNASPQNYFHRPLCRN